MNIGTEVFKRIVLEARVSGQKTGMEVMKRAAVKVVADTMQETARFGTFVRSYVERCAEYRLNSELEV